MTSQSLLRGSNFWYLIHCKSAREQYATLNLQTHLGITVFYPKIQVQSQGKIRDLPFFPGYIFIHANLQEKSLNQINTCPGVLRLVLFSEEPQPVPDDVIETISAHLDRLNLQGPQPLHHFCAGDLVRLKDGPLQDLEMVFVGPTTPGERVIVLLSLLGRLKQVHVEARKLEKVSNQNNYITTSLKRERHTRGKGRKIKKPA